MKAFHFRLDTVKRVRTLQERIALDSFVLAQQEHRQARAKSAAATGALHALEVPSGVVPMANLHELSDQAERRAASVQACREAEVAAHTRASTARVTWQAAATRAGVLQRLHDHARADWRADALAEESAELDDVAQTRHARTGDRR